MRTAPAFRQAGMTGSPAQPPAATTQRIFIAFIAASLLVLQAVFGGLVQGVVAAPAPEQAFLLCTGGDHAAAPSAPHGGEDDRPRLPPCCFAGCVMVSPLAAPSPPAPLPWRSGQGSPVLQALPVDGEPLPASPPTAHRARAPPLPLVG